MEVKSHSQAAESIRLVRDGIGEIIANKPHLQMFCSDDCILRFLRARGMDPVKAVSMLSETLQWREEFQMHKIKWQDVEKQAATGKVMIANFVSHEGRVVIILRPGHENNTKDQDKNIQHFAYQMEMATRMADSLGGDGKLMTIIDYSGWSLKKSPPMKTSLATLKIMQHHYPERLHLCIGWHPPSVFSAFWKLLSPFIDPVTAKKVFLLPKAAASREKLSEHVDTSKLDAGMGGAVADVYDKDAWAARLTEQDRLYQEALEAFTASQKPSAVQPAE